MRKLLFAALCCWIIPSVSAQNTDDGFESMDLSAAHTLIFKTAYRYNQHAVFGAFVCIISYSGQYHQ